MSTGNGGHIIGVIPARGGSKGLPRKNILPLMGKPLLAYTVETAQRARTLDRVILSTDSEEIAAVGRQYGVEVPFIRPAHLATDTAHPTAVMKHAVSFLEDEAYAVDLVVILQPTSPLRQPEHIDQAVHLLQENSELDSVVTVQEVDHPAFSNLRAQGSVLSPFVNDGVDYSQKRRQDLERMYRPNGAVYVTRRWLLMEKGVIFSAFVGGKTGYLLMDPFSSLEIDTRIDLMVIEAVLQEQREDR